VTNWIKACDRMLAWDVETVVPGHGAITDKGGIREQRDYLAYLMAQSRKCYDEGMSFELAAERIALDRWAHYAEDERMYVNVYACYRELSDGTMERPDIQTMYTLMGQRHFGKQAH